MIVVVFVTIFFMPDRLYNEVSAYAKPNERPWRKIVAKPEKGVAAHERAETPYPSGSKKENGYKE